MKPEVKRKQRQRRARRVRLRIKKTAPESLRISIYRSLEHIYVQLIDDVSAKTLVSTSDREVKADKTHLTKSQKAALVGKLMADKIKKLKLKRGLVVDKGSYKYHGRVKAFIEALRDSGIKI